MLRAAILALLLVASTAAWSQQQKLDPRIASELLAAQAAELSLRDALIKAMREDVAKREADLAEWFKGWFITGYGIDGGPKGTP